MVQETCAKSLLTEDEVASILDGLLSRSREIFVKTTNLREVKQFIEAEVERTIWSPPGPRLVK
jgi:chromosome condensin MukBEF ATPase and DNA-binding subunit MukB